MPPRGSKMSAEQKVKIGAANKGKLKGRKLSEKQKAALRAAHLGRPLSEEHKAKIGAANKGRRHTEEAKAKISAARTGTSMPERSEATRAKLSAALKGRPKSEEHKAKLRAAGWREEIGYEGAHVRTRLIRSAVSELSCCRCEKPAENWAFNHQPKDPSLVRHDERGRPYSLDPADYQPMCCGCHVRMDHYG